MLAETNDSGWRAVTHALALPPLGIQARATHPAQALQEFLAAPGQRVVFIAEGLGWRARDAAALVRNLTELTPGCMVAARRKPLPSGRAARTGPAYTPGTARGKNERMRPMSALPPVTSARVVVSDGQADAARQGRRGAAAGDDPHTTTPRIDLTTLPGGAPAFLGREPELALLDAAWSGAGAGAGPQVVTLIAPGGVGKTALVKRWLDGLRGDGWRGAERVFGWSFCGQGTGDDRQACDDNFISEALAWFGVAHDPASSPWDKGLLLAAAVAARRTLLILDGCEPLQYPPGPLAGQLRAAGLKALLTQLADTGQPGLTLITSRETLADLTEYTRGPAVPRGSVLTRDLENLSDTDGARLLHRLGCGRAGAAAGEPEDAQLCTAARAVHGHALTLNLLGRYLAQAAGGDIRRRDTLGLPDAGQTPVDPTHRVLAAYETWFTGTGRTVELAALLLLGFFDRPADPGCMAALRAAPPIAGLTEPLQGLTRARWNLALRGLVACGLIERSAPHDAANRRPDAAQRTPGVSSPTNPDPALGSADPDAAPSQPDGADPLGAHLTPGALDTHPLVREYLGRRLRTTLPDAWREGHRRLYVHLTASAPRRPDGLAGLQPLYQAVAHGCLAGLQQEARAAVYRDRILRGTGDQGFYSISKLAAFGADLGAVACFFEAPWERVSTALTEPDRAWVMNQAAFCLRALGRLDEALGPMRAGVERFVRQEDWTNAAISAGNLSDLGLTLGLVAEAVADAGRSVAYADRSGDAFWCMGNRTTLGDALHQQGARAAARARFREAEAMQAQRQPEYPLLYSLWGYRYCDLLLAAPERAAWQVWLAGAAPGGGDADTWSPGSHAGLGGERDPRAECEAVLARAQMMFAWRLPGDSFLTIALDHLSLARAALFAALLDPAGPPRPALDRAADAFTAAVDGLRAAGQQPLIPLGLLPRALLHTLLHAPAAARADLNEAWAIAARGDLRLCMADCHLHRARLFKDRAALAQARVLIAECGYGRRKEELADAAAAAGGW